MRRRPTNAFESYCDSAPRPTIGPDDIRARCIWRSLRWEARDATMMGTHPRNVLELQDDQRAGGGGGHILGNGG